MPRRERIGLGVGRTAVRAVLLRGDTIAWSAERPVEDPGQLSQAIASVLSSAPVPRVMRPPVVAALSPAFAQVKRLSGVPLEVDITTATRVIAPAVSSHFLRNGVPLTQPVVHRSNGCWWGSVFEEPTLSAVQQGCALAHFALEGFVPAVTALAEQKRDGRVEWSDGGAHMSMRVTRGVWSELRRDRSAVMGDQLPFGDAIAAAHSSRRSPLFVRPRQDRRWHAPAMRGALSAAALLTLLLAIAAPGLSASRRLARETREIRELEARAAEWMPAAHELRQSTQALAEIAEFAASRQSALELLETLADALPDSTAIVTLRVDSAGGSMTLLSRSATAVLPALAQSSALAEPRIGGSVTRETLNGVALQRVAVRFRVARARREVNR